jgi:hypothetical protein
MQSVAAMQAALTLREGDREGLPQGLCSLARLQHAVT